MASIKSSASQNWFSTGRQNKRNSRLRWTLLATAPVALGLVSAAHGQSLTFDASGSATSSSTVTDGSGFWDVTNSLGNPDTNWFSSLFDSTWINGDAAVFGNAANNPGSGAAGNVKIDDDSGSVTASGITFNAAQSGNYTISAIAGDSLTLSGTGTINVASGFSPTISAPIAGGAGLTMTGPGTLNLTGNNTYSGTTSINGGAVVVGPGGNLGAATNALNLGPVAVNPSFATTGTATLAINNSTTVGSFSVQTSSTTANQLSIGSGQTLTVGSFSVGLTPTSSAIATTTTALTITGGGSLVVSPTGSANFFVEQGPTTTANVQNDIAIVDMTGLANFTFGNAGNTGEFDVGVHNHAQGTLKLAATSTVTANGVRVGDSGGPLGSTSSVNNGLNTSTLSFGSVSNLIDANTIVVGFGKGAGAMNFATSSGTLTLNNEAGTGGAVMIVGDGGSGTGSATGTVNFNGHLVNLNLASLAIGQHLANSSTTANVGGTGSFSFDDGVTNVGSLIMAHTQGGGNTEGFSSATLSVGGSASTTATLNVNIGGVSTPQDLINVGFGGSGTTETSILTIGVNGIVNVNGSLVTVIGGTNTAAATINLNGGTLNLMGSTITQGTSGTGSVATITLNATAGTLENIASINSGGGVTMATAGNTLTFAGSNGWGGATAVNAGTAVLASGGSLGNTPVSVNSTANFIAYAGTSIGSTAAGTANGSLAINNGGTLSIIDSGTPGNLNINQQSSAIAAAVGLALAGTTNLNFQLGTSAVDGIAVNGLLTVSDASSTNLVNILTAGDASLTPGAYALITDANGDISGGGTASFKFASDSSSTETITVGSQQYQLTLSTSSTSETLNVATIGGGPANLTWNNVSANNLWDTAVSSNWNNGATNTVFHASDNVTFNDSNGGAGNYAVTLNSIVSPGSIVVNNSAGNYVISGTGTIGGTASLTKSGSGSLTLSTPNTYSGGTIVNQGLLEILRTSATTSALPRGAVTITGGMLQLATNVTAGSQSSPTPASNVNITSLAISGTGQLDINNNHIIINYGGGPDPIASIAALIKSGFNSGAWNGTGIMSTYAQSNGGSYGIGYADSADPGNPAGLASGQIEIEYTLLGDANLDGAVNGSDFAILATNFNKAVSGWDAGDFNYDGAANGADFASLASNFNKGASQAADLTALDSFAAANGLSASVPEPASAGLLVLGAMGMLSQRRRKGQR